MKKLRIAYFIITAAFIYWMYDPTISSLLSYDYAVDFFVNRLGYPVYFLPFTGLTKLLGLLALLVPGFPRIKEWVYAGFTYDLIGAIYSLLSIGIPVSSIWPQFLAFFLMVGSYVIFYLMQKRVDKDENLSLWNELRNKIGR